MLMLLTSASSLLYANMTCVQPPSKKCWEKTARKTSISCVLMFFSTTEVPSCDCSVFASSGRVQGSGSPQPPSHYPRKQGGHWHSWGNSGLHWFTIPRYSGFMHKDMKIFVADQRRIEERKEVWYVFSFYSPFSKNRILLTSIRMTCVHFLKKREFTNVKSWHFFRILFW